MADVVGTIKVNATLDSAKFEAATGNLEKTTMSKFESMSSKAAASFTKAMATVAKTVATTAAAITTLAVKNYADYEQLTGGVEKLFGDAYDTVVENAEEAYKTAGMSANEYMETVTSFSASLISGLGGDTAKAAETADEAITDMADNANTFGTSIDLIQNAYQGFAKQNYTMLDNLKLGYGGTATEMARLVNDSGVLGDTFTATADNINEVSFDKIIEAIHTVQEEMGITGTTANEAAGTVSGSFSSMKAAAENFATALAGGGDISPTMDSMTNSINDFVGNLLPVVEEVAKNLPSAISSLVPVLSGTIISLLPSVTQMLIDLADGIIQQLPTILQQILNGLVAVFPTLLSGITTLFTTLVEVFASPDFLTMLLNAAVELFLQLVYALPQIIDALIGALPDVISAITVFLTDPNTILQLLNAAVQLFLALTLAVPQILSSLIGAFGELIGNVWSGISQRFTEFFTNLGDTISGIFKNAINGVLGFLENIINGPINLINGFIDAINTVVGVLGISVGKLPTVTLPRLASGGYVSGEGTSTSDSIPALLSNGEYVVNAKAVDLVGREYLDSINSGRIPAGGGIQVNQTNNNYSQFDLDSANANLYNKLRTAHA